MLRDVMDSPVWQSLRRRLIGELTKHALLHGDFTLASGAKSKTYLDVRRYSLQTKGMYLIGKVLWPLYNEFDADAVGGPTSGADPIVASILACPTVPEGVNINGFFIRKESKDHGTGNQLEGALEGVKKVVVVEDVTTSGGSAMRAIEAVRKADLEVLGVLSVVDREVGAAALFTAEEIPFLPATCLSEIMEMSQNPAE